MCCKIYCFCTDYGYVCIYSVSLVCFCLMIIYAAITEHADDNLRPMSHLRFSRAILSREKIARENRKCDMASRASF